MLNLMEELLLLALREKGEKGRIKFRGVDLRFGSAGAALTDLSPQSRIERDKQKRWRHVDRVIDLNGQALRRILIQ